MHFVSFNQIPVYLPAGLLLPLAAAAQQTQAIGTLKLDKFLGFSLIT
jgi:hypothetical protein